VLEPFGSLLPAGSPTPQQRQQAELLDQLWEQELEEFYDRMQLRPGQRVLVYGCGLGHELPRLARRVGPQGEIVGVQPNPFLAHEVRQYLKDFPYQKIRVVLGQDNEPIPLGLYDVIFMPWRLNSIQPTPGAQEVRDLLQRLRPWLSPQGRLAIWEESPRGMHLFPALPLLERTVKRWERRSPPQPPRLLGLAADFAYCSILWENARPLQKAEVPGSPTSRWFESWLSQQAPEWLDSGLLSPRQWEMLQQQWDSRRVYPGTLYFSPQALSVVGRALS
jgi:SAM-dependent methyltransferase